MKIINELATSTIKTNKKDTLATKLSILLAVVLLGTVIIIIGSLRVDKYNEIVSTTGDYQVSIFEIEEQMYDSLTNNKDIEQVSFDRFVEDEEIGVIIYERSKNYWKSR